MDIFIHPNFEEIYRVHPLILIDVGASGGIAERWKPAKRHLKVVGFEPDARAFRELDAANDKHSTFINAALSDREGSLHLNLARKQQVSSQFAYNRRFVEQFPDAGRFETVGSAVLEAKRLSLSLLADAGLDDADFLKIDTEGGELAVLQGAEEILDGPVFGIEVEVIFADLRSGQPHFCEVDAFLRKKGFQLFDMKRYFWKRSAGQKFSAVKGQLILADALYIKTYEALAQELANLDRERGRAKLFKALAVCLVYGLLDYALYVCEQAAKDGQLSTVEKNMIFKALGSKGMALNLKGRSLAARLLYALFLRVKPNSFAFVDEELGNEFLRW